jgi:hypothetical protein
MSRGVQAFKQTDVTKAIKGARNANLDVERIEIGRDGRIVIHTGKAGAAAIAADGHNEWDDVK